MIRRLAALALGAMGLLAGCALEETRPPGYRPLVAAGRYRTCLGRVRA